MTDIKNITGKPVSGKNFYPRPTVIHQVYRRLESGDNIYLSAPRRVGKTSIMYHLKENPHSGYLFIYANTEAVHDTEEYFEKLVETLLNDEAFQVMVHTSEKAKSTLAKILRGFKGIKAFGIEFEVTGEGDEDDKPSEAFRKLLQKLNTGDTKIVIMVDEFPATIENIKKTKNAQEAIRFLQLNREIRQEPNAPIQFIFTGSIGLPVVVSAMEVSSTVNDLNLIQVEPMDREDASGLAKALLDSAGVPYLPGVIGYLLDKVRWLMPYYIQLVAQGIIAEHDRLRAEATFETVDNALNEIYTRRDDHIFDSFFTRLQKSFQPEDHQLALDLLRKIACSDALPADEVIPLALQENDRKRYRNVLRTLDYDGYVHQSDNCYCFYSPVLQMWWKHNA